MSFAHFYISLGVAMWWLYVIRVFFCHGKPSSAWVFAARSTTGTLGMEASPAHSMSMLSTAAWKKSHWNALDDLDDGKRLRFRASPRWKMVGQNVFQNHGVFFVLFQLYKLRLRTGLGDRALLFGGYNNLKNQNTMENGSYKIQSDGKFKNKSSPQNTINGSRKSALEARFLRSGQPRTARTPRHIFPMRSWGTEK